MSYTVLARRYRSATFDEVVGQEPVAQTLKKAIESGRVAHAYLFCGTRGVGKTSMARILAKALNCEKSKGPTATPCLKCNSCQAIATGEDIDVIEIDAASHTGVDNVRDLIANASFMPARSRFKIYIIDEVHMLSKAAFNALLKTMEEPPAHVKFILATTEPEKVLPTILSRCQRYDFRTISARETAEHLKEISKKEKIEADDDALLLIARAGAGSMRDSLSLLDRLLSVGEKRLTVELIESMLGLPRGQQVYELVESIGSGDVKSALVRADEMIASGLGIDTLTASLTDHLRSLLIVRVCGDESTLVEVPGVSRQEISAQAQRFEPAMLAQDIVILEELRRQLRSTQAQRALLDATLVRLTLAEQFTPIGDVLAGKSSGATSRAAPSKAPVAPSTSTSKTSAPALKKKSDEEVIAPQRDESAPAHLETEPVDVNDLPRVWQEVLKLVEERPALHSLVAHGELVSLSRDRAVIQYQPQHTTFVKMLDRNGKKDVVRGLLEKVSGRSLGVELTVADVSEQTSETATAVAPAPVKRASATPVKREVPTVAPAAPAAQTMRVTSELVEELCETEPLVRAVIDELGATVVKVER